jgi:hypothetical protein
MSWNYQILHHVNTGFEPYYALHEVFYDDNGEPRSWTQDPIGVAGEDENEIIKTLELMLKDATTRSVLTIRDGKIV